MRGEGTVDCLDMLCAISQYLVNEVQVKDES